MIKCGDEIELIIEKLTYEGSALGRYEGLAVFVKNAAPGDKLKIKITKLNKSYALGQIVEIIEPAKCRKKPFCPLFNACGGCTYQYIDYDFLLQQKNNMLYEAFLKLHDKPEFLKPLKSPLDKCFRHKIQYRVSETRNSKRLLVGYFKEKSHDITNIKICPIQPPLTDEMAQFVRDNWSLGAYIEKKHTGLLRNFVLRFSSDLKSALVTLVLNVTAKEFVTYKTQTEDFFKKMQKKFPQIKGCVVNFNPEKTNRIFSNDFQTILGDDFIYEVLKSRDGSKKTYKVSSSSFFQVNPLCAVNIFDAVKEKISENSIILDAYGGVGAIGIWVSDKTRKVVLVEENKEAVCDAKENFKLNQVKSYEVYLADAKEQFKIFLKEKKKFAHVILDPPRKGADKDALEILSNLTDSIIYVSCNPQTLVRDIEHLYTLGFKAKTTQAVDMFPYSYHIESVTLIERV